MSTKKTTTKIPTMDELRAKWEKLQPKWKSGRPKNFKRWALHYRDSLKKRQKASA